MQVIDLPTIQSRITHAATFDAVTRALTAIARSEVEAPEELAFTLNNGGEIHIKGARLAESPWVVFKVASGSFPHGTASGCSIVVEATTGVPTALLDDGGWLTEMRTAAAGAVAADVMAVNGPLRVAILGTGGQARFQLAALRDRRELTEVRVWGRDASKAVALAAETNSQSAASVDEAVDGVDLIVTTTSAREPILYAHHLRPGVHVTAMGSDMKGKRELHHAVLDAATVIAAEDISTAARVGELQHTPQHVDRAVPLAALVADAEPGEWSRKPGDITVADLCGIGAYDAAIAGVALA